MYSRHLGRSGLNVSAITLGLMVRDCRPGDAFESVRRTVLRAIDLGVTTIDLATGYGGGAVERAMGDILRTDLRARRADLILATKAGWADGSRRTLVDSLERSLSHLGVDHVDLYSHHAADAHTPIEETVDALVSLVRQGKTRYVGISNYSLADTVRIAPLFTQAGVPCVAHQCNYNLLNRWIEDGLLHAMPALGMSAMIFSAVNQGLLSDASVDGPRAGSRAERSLAGLVAGVPTGEPAYGKYPSDDVRAHVLKVLRDLRDVARERGQTLAQLAVTWVLRHPQVASSLVGVSSPEQVEEAAIATTQPALSDEERARINAILPPRFGML